MNLNVKGKTKCENQITSIKSKKGRSKILSLAEEF